MTSAIERAVYIFCCFAPYKSYYASCIALRNVQTTIRSVTCLCSYFYSRIFQTEYSNLHSYFPRLSHQQFTYCISLPKALRLRSWQPGRTYPWSSAQVFVMSSLYSLKLVPDTWRCRALPCVLPRMTTPLEGIHGKAFHSKSLLQSHSTGLPCSPIEEVCFMERKNALNTV